MIAGRLRRLALAFLVAALSTAIAVSLFGGHSASTAGAPVVESELALPGPVKPTFTVATPRPLEGRGTPHAWAPVMLPASVRERPAADSRELTRLRTSTPEGTTNIVVLLARAEDADGRLWVRVRLAGLPGRSSGWVPRLALGGHVAIDTHLVVDLSRLTATLLRVGRPIFRADIGVGTAGAPTPTGRFYIRNRLTRYRSAFYGPIAFGTSARSAVLTDWPAGGFIGIHGTDRPDLLPGRVSHGCIRMRNADILKLARLMPVGTLLTIR